MLHPPSAAGRRWGLVAGRGCGLAASSWRLACGRPALVRVLRSQSERDGSVLRGDRDTSGPLAALAPTHHPVAKTIALVRSRRSIDQISPRLPSTWNHVRVASGTAMPHPTRGVDRMGPGGRAGLAALSRRGRVMRSLSSTADSKRSPTQTFSAAAASPRRRPSSAPWPRAWHGPSSAATHPPRPRTASGATPSTPSSSASRPHPPRDDHRAQGRLVQPVMLRGCEDQAIRQSYRPTTTQPPPFVERGRASKTSSPPPPGRLGGRLSA